MARAGTAVSTRQTGHNVLGIYLNDHLAGATAGTELARRVAGSHHDSGRRRVLRPANHRGEVALTGVRQLGPRPRWLPVLPTGLITRLLVSAVLVLLVLLVLAVLVLVLLPLAVVARVLLALVVLVLRAALAVLVLLALAVLVLRAALTGLTLLA
jgi:hypothetical protein